MSNKVSGLVWDLELDPPAKLVLLAMADHADHNGENMAAPVGLIAYKTDSSTRNVHRVIKKLVDLGILEITYQEAGRPNVYRINLAVCEQYRKEPYKGFVTSRYDKQIRNKTPDKLSHPRQQRTGKKKAATSDNLSHPTPDNLSHPTPDNLSWVDTDSGQLSPTPDNLSHPYDNLSHPTPDKLAIDSRSSLYKENLLQQQQQQGGGGGGGERELTETEEFLIGEGFTPSVAYEFRLFDLEACAASLKKFRANGTQNGGVVNSWRVAPPRKPKTKQATALFSSARTKEPPINPKEARKKLAELMIQSRGNNE